MTSLAGAPQSLTLAAPGSSPEAAPTILVVDDDAALRMLFERYLTAFGYKPCLAADGDEALRVAAAAPEIRVMIVDLIMPGLSGRALAEQLTVLLPDAIMIFCSGHPASALVRLGIDIKGAHFLQKPCRPAELQRRLSEVLASR